MSNWKQQIEAQIAQISNYLGNGGFFNPELMEHEKVRDMVIGNQVALRALLDVAVAAEQYERACWERNQTMFPSLKRTLDKLREVE